jgi:hypothetical protein
LTSARLEMSSADAYGYPRAQKGQGEQRVDGRLDGEAHDEIKRHNQEANCNGGPYAGGIRKWESAPRRAVRGGECLF